MSRVHVVGNLWELCRAFRACGYSAVDAGPLLGGAYGGPMVSLSDLDAALSSVQGMTVLLRDSGSGLEVCTPDGSSVISTAPVQA